MKITIDTLLKKKKEGRKITMVSTYDYWSAKLCDEVGIDCILVGDSLGMVVQGKSSTLPVSLEEIIYHTQCVQRGVRNAFIVADMPFLSYQVSPEKAVENCGKVIKETEAQAVKLEGGEEIAELVYRLSRIGIPVVGHIGFTPQSINVFGKPKVVGRKKEEEEKLKRDFKALEDAGAFMIILESVPWRLTKELWENSRSVVIGIGAGKFTDGQVLVFHDIVGLFEDFKPKFVRRYLQGAKLIKEALTNFKIDVEKGEFPSEEESYG